MTNNQSQISNDHPLVSVSTIVYNHVRFLRQCIESVLTQQTNFAIEYLIHDDCSTDGSQDIIREYAEKYPDIIKPVFETENQYSKGGPWGSAVWNYPRAKGKYIALCEGDDFWTDPLKLQKQVDFMESHPEYSVCFCTYRNFNIYTNVYMEPESKLLLQQYGNIEGIDVDMDMYFNHWIAMPLVELFRVDALNMNQVHRFKHYRDMHEGYLLLKKGKCRLMNFVGAQRNMHDGGIASRISNKKYCIISLPMDREFFWKTLDRNVPKKNYIATLDAYIRTCGFEHKCTAIRCAFARFLLSGHPVLLINQLKEIFRKIR